jgi:hypothetical protein
VASGYVAGAYVSLATQQSGQSTLVCYQAADPQRANNQAGVLQVINGSTSVGQPSTDGNGTACGTTLVSDTTGLGKVEISDQVQADAVWVCLQAPGVSERLIIPVSGATPPQVKTGAVTPAPAPPAPTAWPASVPSAQCQANGATMLVDANIGGKQLWVAYTNAVTNGAANICVREEDGAHSVGGVLGVNANNVALPFGLSSDLTPCGFVINDLDAPAKLHLDSSQPGSSPQSVCIDAGVFAERLFVTTNAGSSPVSFTPDPGTPA